MSDWKFLNKHRVREGHFGSSENEGCNGYFCFTLFGAKIKVIASDGMGWKHVSASIDKCLEPPNWKMMCAIKDLFFEDEDVVVQFHPKKSQYVNNHPGCLHLWQSLDREFPQPDSLMVGIK